MLKFIIPLFALAFLSPAAAQTPTRSNIQVVAKKVTLESRKSDPQKFKGGNTRLEEKEVAYEFAIRNASAVSREVTIGWKVYRESMLGRLAVAGNGSKAGTLQPGKTIKLTTDAVQVDEREIRTKRVSGDLEETLAGYVLTITDKAGAVLLQKFSSKDIQEANEAGTGERPNLFRDKGESRPAKPKPKGPGLRKRLK